MDTLKRYLTEFEGEKPHRQYQIVDVTGVQDPAYIVGVDSPWLGKTIYELEQLIETDPDYSELERKRLLKQLQTVRLHPERCPGGDR